jgi:hypothetical protein
MRARAAAKNTHRDALAGQPAIPRETDMTGNPNETEVCLVQTVLPALEEGFDVYFVSDCSGGVSREAHDDAKARMLQAGAKPITWAA